MTLPDPAELERTATGLLASFRVLDTSVRVVWNARLTTTAGRAFLQRGQIELNPRLLARAPDRLPAVLAHETAHLAVFRLFGPNIPAHGRHWRSMMRLAGHPPDVTHDIPVHGLRRPGGTARPARATRRRYFYLRVCDGCGARAIDTAVRYGRCHGCAARDRYLVIRAPATAAGRRALEGLDLAAVRARCGASPEA